MKRFYPVKVFVLILLLYCNPAMSQDVDSELFASVGTSASFIHSPEIQSGVRLGLNTGFGFRSELSDRIDYLLYFDWTQMGANSKGRIYENDEFSQEMTDCKYYFSQINLVDIISYDVIDPVFRIQGGFTLACKLPFGKGIVDDRIYFGSSDIWRENVSAESMYENTNGNIGFIAGIGTGSDIWQLNLNYTYFIIDMCRGLHYNSESAFPATNSVLEINFLVFVERL